MLIITLGDPHSINVELIASYIQARQVLPFPCILVGSRWQWDDQCSRLGLNPPKLRSITNIGTTVPALAGMSFLDIGGPKTPAEDLSSAERGLIARRSLEALTGVKIPTRLAVLTAPIDKHACHDAGFEFPGQTEFFEYLWNAPGIMVLAGPKLRVALATNHCAVKDIAGLITPERIVDKIALLAVALQTIFGIAKPRIAVCGLNPHCGDHGSFGDEEIRVLQPAIQSFKQAGVTVSGPISADLVFYRAARGDFDGVLAMYHDQGLGPLKTLHFEEAVNVTGGLPHLRISPDHGPAADLFLKRRANPRSFECAMSWVFNYFKV